MDESIAAAEAEGRTSAESIPAAREVIVTLMDRFDRNGKLSGAGFYDYTEGKRAGLWPDLRAELKTTRDLSVLSPTCKTA